MHSLTCGHAGAAMAKNVLMLLQPADSMTLIPDRGCEGG